VGRRHAVITKAPGTGGRVNFDTVRQQLLYEVHNPHAYHSPDVVLDMGGIHLHDEGHDRVRLTGARGQPAGRQLKVVAGYRDGFKAEVTWGFSWPDAWDKAQAARPPSAPSWPSGACRTTSCTSNTRA
jgi:hypothetical protein